MKKTYLQNIELEENKGYEKFVEQIVAHHKLDDKYMAIISSHDIVNVIYLCCLKLCEIISKKKNKPTFKDRMNNIHNILNCIDGLYDALPQETKEIILFYIGLSIVLTLDLDERPVFNKVIESVSNRNNANLAALKAKALSNNNPS